VQLRRDLEDPQALGDVLLRHLVLLGDAAAREPAVVDQPLEGLRLLDRVQVDAQAVGEQREVEALRVLVRRADEHGHLDKRSFDAGAVAPLTVDQAVLAVDRRREEQRLQQPVLLDRRRQALELGLVELVARVEAVSDDRRRQRDGAQSG
jgi:hypothetical protein